MITFDQLCHDARCTQAEREILARYLALLRYEATLRLGRPNISGSARREAPSL